MIHSHAIVDPTARIAAGVTIGAFSIVEAGVEVGEGTWIGPYVTVRSGTRIGRDNRIYQYVSVGEDPQYAGYQGEPTRLEIGDRNIVREYCTVNRGTPVGRGVTNIGHDNFLMAYVHIAHDCVIGNHTILANGTTLGGHVQVFDYAVLGGFALIHQFCRIGTHSITGGGAVCVKDVPPYLMAAGDRARSHGVNTRGLRRRQFPAATVTGLRRAYRAIFRSGLDLETALEQVDADGQCIPEIAILADFIRTTGRGIIR